MRAIFSERITDLRKDSGLTQKDLSLILNISEDMLSSYERDIAPMPDETMVKLARHFNVSLDYLLGLIDEQIGYKHDNMLCIPNGFTNEAVERAKHYVGLLALEIRHNEGKS